MTADRLRTIVRDCLDRCLFTIEEAWERLAASDMNDRRGATLLRAILAEGETS